MVGTPPSSGTVGPIAGVRIKPSALVMLIQIAAGSLSGAEFAMQHPTIAAAAFIVFTIATAIGPYLQSLGD